MEEKDIGAFVEKYNPELRREGYRILGFSVGVINENFPFVPPSELALVQVVPWQERQEFPPLVSAQSVERVLPKEYQGVTLLLQYLSKEIGTGGLRLATKPKALAPIYPRGVVEVESKKLNGQELYDALIKRHPEILESYGGEDIWIHPKTRNWVIGGDMGVARKLEVLVGNPEESKNFYSRQIGHLAHL